MIIYSAIKVHEKVSKKQEHININLVLHCCILGLAYVGTVCTPSSQSIVEDHFGFIMITVAAHELGHRYVNIFWVKTF